VYGITRVVGYFSRTSNWNKSKLGELKDRQRGRYSVERAMPPTPAPARAPAETTVATLGTAAG
jgi:hypothetical protein